MVWYIHLNYWSICLRNSYNTSIHVTDKRLEKYLSLFRDKGICNGNSGRCLGRYNHWESHDCGKGLHDICRFYDGRNYVQERYKFVSKQLVVLGYTEMVFNELL